MMDARASVLLAGVVTQGRADASQYVTSYSVQTASSVGGRFTSMRGSDGSATFGGNSNKNGKVYNYFEAPVYGRYVRIRPLTRSGHPAMRAAILLYLDGEAMTCPEGYARRSGDCEGEGSIDGVGAGQVRHPHRPPAHLPPTLGARPTAAAY